MLGGLLIEGEPLATRPARVSQSIGEETQYRLAALALLDAFLAALAEPQRRARRLEPFDRPVLRGDEERMRVTGVRVCEHTLGRMGEGQGPGRARVRGIRPRRPAGLSWDR